jgi:hypothetical protein
VRVPTPYDQHICDLLIMETTFHGKLWHEDGNRQMLMLRKSDKTGLNYLLNKHPSEVLHRRKQSSLIIH